MKKYRSVWKKGGLGQYERFGLSDWRDFAYEEELKCRCNKLNKFRYMNDEVYVLMSLGEHRIKMASSCCGVPGQNSVDLKRRCCNKGKMSLINERGSIGNNCYI